jgi:hypothetical protein
MSGMRRSPGSRRCRLPTADEPRHVGGEDAATAAGAIERSTSAVVIQLRSEAVMIERILSCWDFA